MRVFEIQETFGLEHLVAAERDPRSPGPGEVILRMRAVSLNYRDLLMVRGEYNPRQPLPLIPCSDGVGIVDACGEGVDRVAVGDRVLPIFAQGWLDGDPDRAIRRTTLGGPLDGTLRDEMVLSAEGVVSAPPSLGDVEAAALPCAGLTAWNAVGGETPVGPGETVLVLGTGGVSLFALQLATALGARVIVTSSRREKLERAAALGAWRTVSYVDEPRWGRAVRELTGGRGVDRVVEVGGAATLAESVQAVRMGGTIMLIGSLTGGKAPFDFVPVFMQQVRIQGILVGHRRGLEELCRFVESRRIRPVVDATFSFAEARDAFVYLEKARHFGKIGIEIAS